MKIEPGTLFKVRVPVTLYSPDFSHYVFPGGSLIMFIDAGVTPYQGEQVPINRMLTKRGMLCIFDLHAYDDYYLSMETQ